MRRKLIEIAISIGLTLFASRIKKLPIKKLEPILFQGALVQAAIQTAVEDEDVTVEESARVYDAVKEAIKAIGKVLTEW